MPVMMYLLDNLLWMNDNRGNSPMHRATSQNPRETRLLVQARANRGMPQALATGCILLFRAASWQDAFCGVGRGGRAKPPDFKTP